MSCDDCGFPYSLCECPGVRKTLEHFKARFPTLYGHAGLFDFSCPPGWLNLVWELSEQLEPLGVHAQQVKCKFGGLRFYISEGHVGAIELITDTENKSADICQECGQPGVMDCRKGWIGTLCQEHWNKRP